MGLLVKSFYRLLVCPDRQASAWSLATYRFRLSF